MTNKEINQRRRYYKLIPDFASMISNKGVLIALDFGKKRIGIARSNIDRTVVLPLITIINDKDKSIKLKELNNKYIISGIIIGLPISLSGKYTSITQSTISFTREILGLFPEIPILLYDERLSTSEAEKRLLHIDKSTRLKSIDSVAAQILLERFLDQLSSKISFGFD